jgi:hypothetical protein
MCPQVIAWVLVMAGPCTGASHGTGSWVHTFCENPLDFSKVARACTQTILGGLIKYMGVEEVS